MLGEITSLERDLSTYETLALAGNTIGSGTAKAGWQLCEEKDPSPGIPKEDVAEFRWGVLAELTGNFSRVEYIQDGG